MVILKKKLYGLNKNYECYNVFNFLRLPHFLTQTLCDFLIRFIVLYHLVNDGDTKIFHKNSDASLCSLRKYTSSKNIYTNGYNDTSKRFQGFFDLMFQWKGSVFKLIWHNLFLFIVIYIFISVTYRYVLVQNPEAKEIFEIICIYCSR